MVSAKVGPTKTLEALGFLLEQNQRLARRVEKLEHRLSKKLTPKPFEPWMATFVQALRECGGKAVKAHQVARQRDRAVPSIATVYDRRQRCQEFADRWTLAMREVNGFTSEGKPTDVR